MIGSVLLQSSCTPLRLVKSQEGVIADYRDQAELELPRLMYSYELKRVRYLLQAYHRIRLQKIEKFILHILEKEEILMRLSEKEKAYAQVEICNFQPRLVAAKCATMSDSSTQLPA